MSYIIEGAEYEEIECVNCGIRFYAPAAWNRERRRSHNSFWCPNGHSLSYKSMSDVEQARAEKEAAQARASEAEHLRLVAERAKQRAETELRRLKARHDAGVCLHCNRTFNNLARHIQTKHPAQIEGGKTRKQIAPPLVN